MKRTPKLAALAAFLCLVLFGSSAFAQEAATPNDVAHFLAGLRPSPSSPLDTLTQDKGWQQHALQMNAAWSDHEQRQLSKIRAWSSANLKNRRPVTFYFFSGPDFMYVDTFFPGSSIYVMAGLEPTGPMPDLAKLRKNSLPNELAGMRDTLGTILRTSYFITSEMNSDLHSGQLRGTLPVLYVFLARAGKTIREVTFVSLSSEGEELPDNDAKGVTKGVKIFFSGADGKVQTLYYFRTDLSNNGVRNSGFLQFCARLGIGDVFIKAASYLLHAANFSTVRDFLLGNGASIVQDDTGIPVTHFLKGGWQLYPFGEYAGPIPMFRGHYQPKLDELFERVGAPPIEFGVGYRWRPKESHVLLAVSTARRPTAGEPAASSPEPAAPKADPAPAPAPASASQKSGDRGGAAKPSQPVAQAPPPPQAAAAKISAPVTPGAASHAVPPSASTAPETWRGLVFGGLMSVALANVFGPGGVAAGLSFVLQLSGLGGVVWLLAGNAGGEAPTAPQH
jgi:hypothetical protein